MQRSRKCVGVKIGVTTGAGTAIATAIATAISTTLLAAAVLATTAPAEAAQRVLQLNEDGSTTRTLTARAAPSILAGDSAGRICEPGAKWVRLGFRSLVLQSYDSLVVTSSGGDRYVFQGKAWNDRSFSTRAFRGECVTLQPYFASRDSRYQLSDVTSGRQPLDAAPSRKAAAPLAGVASVVVAGAGDICDTTVSSCQSTSDLIVSINPTAVYTSGDNAYTNGTLSEYNARYAPTWGRFKTLTHPSPGNHDYNTASAAGYFDYFNGSGVQTGAAGDRSKGYYSWDVGDWHFIALNTMSGSTVATAQVTWLNSDLAANTKPCTAAYFHHPLISEGNYAPSGSTYSYSTVKPLYDALYAAKADLVLVGHDHNYQRYAKMNPSLTAASDGFRQLLVGTGGRVFYSMTGTHPLLEASNDNTYGVLKLTLTATGYTGDFVPAAGGGGFSDHFTGTCNKAGTGTNAPPVANFSASTSGLTANFTDSSTDSDGTIASRNWNFGDGTSSTVASPSHTYAAAGTYTVALTVTDNGGATNTVSKSVTVSSGTNAPPVANFSASTSGLTANFTDSSTDSDGTIASRNWNFGDGSAASTATNPSHAYAAAGTYTVALTVTDNGGATNTVSKSVTVTAPSCGGTVLCSGVAVALPTVAKSGVSSNYTLVVPAGKTSVVFNITGGSGDADLYVKLGAAPTSSVYDCRPYLNGNTETCTMTPPAGGGTYYVNVRAYAAYSGVSLKGTVSP